MERAAMIGDDRKTGADRALIGIGLREPHAEEIMATRPGVFCLEVHAENYMNRGPAARRLELLRRDYPLSLHGVALSLASAEPLDLAHLGKLKALVECFEPMLVSEHLAWSALGGVYFNDLLPLPYTEESLDLMVRRVIEVQEVLGRTILIENPSSYLRFGHSTIPEAEFLAELARRSFCRLLCDINNIFVTCENFGQDPHAYLAALPSAAIGEIHLAGHHRMEIDGVTLLIDDHGSAVSDAVWDLYAEACRKLGPVPTVIEWDSRLPELPVLLGEARRAAQLAERPVIGSPVTGGCDAEAA
jgi:uncharacterized protein